MSGFSPRSAGGLCQVVSATCPTLVGPRLPIANAAQAAQPARCRGRLEAALNLLDYPDAVARRIGREVLNELGATRPLVLARRSAKARALNRPPCSAGSWNATGDRPSVSVSREIRERT